jgi:hypothetical protein
MRKEPIAQGRSYRYLLLIFILFIGILALYLSCKSKSPTEATSALNSQIAGQSTNNTTTSSSTTTTIQANNPPTNTTTLITSRTLTSTSTSTSSTSTSTTTSRPTTTTTIEQPKLQWCSFIYENIYYPVKPVTTRGQLCYCYDGSLITLSNFVMKNMGSVPAENVVISVDKIIGDLNHISISQANTGPGRVPNTRRCESMQFKGNDSIVLFISYNASSSEEWTVWLIENYTQTRFFFIIRVT